MRSPLPRRPAGRAGAQVVVPAGAGLRAVALALAAAACGPDGGGAERPDERDAGGDALPVQATDRRVAPLLGPCADPSRYDRNTSWMLPVLVEKLEAAHPAALARAQEELGAWGPEAVPALRRVVERHYANAFESPIVENALDALGRNPAPGAREVLLLGLEHPLESVRARALGALLVHHVRPEDFELFVQRIEGIEPPTMKLRYARALFEADRARAEELWIRWMESGRWRGLWAAAARHVAESGSAELAARAADLAADLPDEVRPWIGALAERFDHEEGRLALDEAFQAPDPERRMLAVLAASAAGLGPRLRDALDDPAPRVRGLAVDALGREEPLPEASREALRAALDDASPDVRGAALERLVERGDPGAIDRALAGLDGRPERLVAAARALRPAMGADPELARRAYERLAARVAREEHRPLGERRPVFQALGLVPLGDAALLLRSVGLAHAGEEVGSLRAHEWLMIQAANTGEAGRAALRAELEHEGDPLRRLDLIDAIGSERAEDAREALLELVADGGRSPYEVLYAASRLATIGPSTIVAPRLKRAAFAMDDAEARRGLRCLLHRWY